MKMIVKLKYFWHFLRYRYNETLKNDCLCTELKTKLEKKAAFHERKALSLLIKM